MIGKSKEHKEGYWAALRDMVAKGKSMTGTVKALENGNVIILAAISLMDERNSEAQLTLNLTKAAINNSQH